MLLEAVKLALRAIRRNALRSILTALGIVIGVAAVIAMVTIGNGTTAKVAAEMAKLGTNLLFVRPGQFGPGRASADAKPFNFRDVEALKTQLAGVRAVAPVAQRAMTAIHGGGSRVTVVTGTDNDYFIAQDWPLAEGRQFLEGELRAGRAACVIGQTVRDKLFARNGSIGQNIRVKNVSCEVIGVLEAKGESSTGTDRDDVILIPLRTFHRRFAGNTDINFISISARADVDTARVQAGTERLLRERRSITRGAEDDFTVRDMRQIAQTAAGTTILLTRLLGAVAAVSLLVGGIGIMNIMLVSVTERTREIGVRMAVGARSRDILAQFLIEALTLSLVGGLLGVALGWGTAQYIAAEFGWPLLIRGDVIALALGVSAGVGVVFGLYPARRASLLDPIEALRYE